MSTPPRQIKGHHTLAMVFPLLASRSVAATVLLLSSTIPTPTPTLVPTQQEEEEQQQQQ
jgi:hypothetical protein